MFICLCFLYFFFFFKQKTAYEMRISDWSSDVCSSDLLLFLHVWDNTTPADEILRGFDDLVRQGKILYIGVSDTPAWQIARLQTMAELRGWTQLVALQAEYSLLQRTAEIGRAHV